MPQEFPFDDGDENDDEQKPAKTAEQLAKDLARMGKALRDSEKARKDAEALAAEAISTNQKATLTAAGFTERQAAVFLKEFDAISDENIGLFKTEVLGQKLEAPAGAGKNDVPDVKAEPAAAEGFDPKLGGGDTKPLGAGMVSVEDLAKIARENPAEADRLVNERKVEMPEAKGVELIWKTQ
jgi:hypothetical protein